MAVILVRACLLGENCRYKGDGCRCDALVRLLELHTVIGVCPEQLGGLSTPREPAEIVGERVLSRSGRDVTAEYQQGAAAALALAQKHGAVCAVLKARSPSCGKGRIHDGTFTGGMADGNGVIAERLLRHGIPVFTEDELPLLEAFLKA